MHSSASWWASRTRQFRAHLRARVAPAERAALEAWTTPGQRALFDSMHVADRRHGLDVVASLRAEGATEPDVLIAGLLHDAGKGDTGVGPRVAYTLGERYGTWVWDVGRVPARLAGRAGAAAHARRDVGRAGRRGRLLAADRRAHPPPGRTDRPRVRRAAPARRRGQLMTPAGRASRSWRRSPRRSAERRAAGPAVTFGEGRRAGAPDPGPDGRIRGPARAPPVAHRGTPARRADRAARGARRRLSRRARPTRCGPARQHQRVRRRSPAS